MKQAVVCLTLAAALLASGCKKRDKVRVQQTEEDTGQLAAIVHAADPKTEAQLLKGFYNIEQNAWRWTAGKFTVALRPPKGAAQKGATLALKFSIPDAVINRLKTIALSARIGGQALAPESYTQAGEFTYTREVDAKLLTGEAVNVDFELDKSLAAGGRSARTRRRRRFHRPRVEMNRALDRFGSVAVWTLAPLVCLALYWRGLLIWFQQDDFAWLALRLGVHSFPDFLRAMFAPMAQGTIRPWSERGFFMGLSWMFGLDALPFRITVFAVVFANLALVASITRRVTGSRVAAAWAPALWIVNTALVAPMTWSSVFNQVLCALFLLAAFHFFLRYVEGERRRDWWWQWVFFLLGFGALEINVVYPALAAAYALCRARRHFAKTLWLFPPSLAFAVLHRLAAPGAASGPYAMHFDASMVTTLGTFWRWAMGPARLENVVVLPTWVDPAGTAIVSAALLGFAAWKMWRRDGLALFCLAWFLITLGPVLPLRDHITDYYLTIPVIGLAILGAWGLACAWRAGVIYGVLALTPVGIYAWSNGRVAETATRWSYKRASRIEAVVGGVARARELHPDRIILLSGVDDELFWTGLLDKPFRLIDLTGVYLTPDSETKITAHPELGQISEFVLPSAATLEGLRKGRVVVYSVAGDRLRNTTRLYEATARAGLSAETPRRVDAGNPLLEYLLGRTWHAREGEHRWMPRRASVTIGAPKSAAQRLFIAGYIPAAELDKGPIPVRVWVDGAALDGKQIERGMEHFEFDYELPPALVGKDSMEVVIESGRTFTPPGDGRELGLAFGVFEVR